MKIKFPKKILNTLITAAIGMVLGSLVLLHDGHDAAPPPPSSNTPAELYANQVGDNLEQVYTSTINNAKESILVIIYALTDHNIIHALQKAQQRGVKVKVISDAKASPYLDEKLGGKIPAIRRFGPGLMHIKIVVADHRQILIGSANLTGESLKMHGNLVMGINDPMLAKMIEDKASTMRIEGFGHPAAYKIFNLGGQTAEMWFLPDNRKAQFRLKKLINAAQKSIRIAMFTWTRRDLAQEVIAAKQRGIDVEVVIDNSAGKGAGAKVVEILKSQGVKVRLSPPGPLLHHKFMYVDGSVLVNGSANWTKAAFTDNDDCFVLLTGLTEKQQNKLNTLWSKIWRDSVAVR